MQLSNDQLANIAHDYYISKLNIAEISAKYNLSRYLIDKALSDAEKTGIVQINIKERAKRNSGLEKSFRQQFGLKEAFILKKLETKNQDSEKIVSFAAEQIQSYMQSSKNVGITWGTTMLDIINSFTEVKNDDLTFVQLVGYPLQGNGRKNPLESIAAAQCGGHFHALPAPLYSSNPDLVNLIKKEPFYEQLDELYDNMDLLVASLGTLQAFEEERFLHEKYESLLFKNIHQKSISGMIFGRPYDHEGHFFSSITDKIIGISDQQIVKTPVRFVVVNDRFKSKALLGALKSGIITHLVTSETIADRVLQLQEESGR
ncbi:DNA-binding transcriptional regulator [Lactobacillus delbrueckii]|uniref:sugar-binding transcriptional regulator n=1 Tax=Lactobacillus delbrueckii TaxID=1584 RepID=UPI001C7036AE|nr:sugar-binding domain-containing protein [Lactobacillus delbrueckii]MBW9308633.1 DNA-binding transcriptional regulator [Lactobacillus delbrueckii]